MPKKQLNFLQTYLLAFEKKLVKKSVEFITLCLGSLQLGWDVSSLTNKSIMNWHMAQVALYNEYFPWCLVYHSDELPAYFTKYMAHLLDVQLIRLEMQPYFLAQKSF